MTGRSECVTRDRVRLLRAQPRDRGSGSVEAVILMPLLFLLLLSLVQGGLWYHARAVALGAAGLDHYDAQPRHRRRRGDRLGFGDDSSRCDQTRSRWW